MKTIVNLTGKVYGKLTVISFHGRNNNKTFWNCHCECGMDKVVHSHNLQQKHTKSCGCLVRNSPNGTTHNKSKTREYEIWCGMKKRCMNTKSKAYKDYGGRGITICERWINSFEDFLADMGPSPTNEHSLDRIENDGNYEPSNCRWATRLVQTNNSRKNVIITHEGTSLTLAQWAAELGIAYKTLHRRLRISNFSTKRAFATLNLKTMKELIS
jgi:hypothetical protein